MNLSKDFKLLIFVFLFTFCLLGLYFLNGYQKKQATKIVLVSKSNPLEVPKPSPVNSQMSLDEINQTLRDLELSNDKKLEIDDIE